MRVRRGQSSRLRFASASLCCRPDPKDRLRLSRPIHSIVRVLSVPAAAASAPTTMLCIVPWWLATQNRLSPMKMRKLGETVHASPRGASGALMLASVIIAVISVGLFTAHRGGGDVPRSTPSHRPFSRLTGDQDRDVPRVLLRAATTSAMLRLQSSNAVAVLPSCSPNENLPGDARLLDRGAEPRWVGFLLVVPTCWLLLASTFWPDSDHPDHGADPGAGGQELGIDLVISSSGLTAT